MNFNQMLEKAINEAIPGAPGNKSAGAVKPNTGKQASGMVLRVIQYDEIGKLIYAVCTISGERSVIAIRQASVQPDLNHPGTASMNPPPWKTGHRIIFNIDDVILGASIGNLPPLPVISDMDETIKFDWGYGVSMN